MSAHVPTATRSWRAPWSGSIARSFPPASRSTPTRRSSRVGSINSIRILKLIAWTEHATGQRIPDASIRMDNFRTVRRIAEAFCRA